MWPFTREGPSGFSWYSTAEDVTEGIDGTGLTAIVTGASNGIGVETARVLAKRGVHVIMGVRNVAAAAEVKKTILKEIKTAKLDVLELDLSSFDSVRQFVSEFNSLNLSLNILINNAGVMGVPFTLSHDGIELQFATNHLGHFLLTSLLLENMKTTSRKSKRDGRIVNVSSEGHKHAYREGICFEKINDMPMYNSFRAYGQSKLANILHANELSRRLQEEGVQITANSVHPGAIITKIIRYHGFLNFCARMFRAVISLIAGKLFLKTVHQGAATTCYVAMHPHVRGVSGKYFIDSNIATPSSKALDAVLASKLWDFSMKLLG